MKERRFFYVPEAANSVELPSDEAAHATRVLRLREGDEIFLMDGCGNFFRGEVTVSTTHRCMYKINETLPQKREWSGRVCLAVAPTKMIDRMEWLAEKATEIGIDVLSLIECKNSERRVVKAERIDKIIVSAVKQSRKAWKPILDGMETFGSFIAKQHGGRKYIAHCYDEIPRTYLKDELEATDSDQDTLVLIGPEGDFSIDEVRAAMEAGFKSVHLGKSRLRTETAGLVATMMMHLDAEIK